jgi:hypothetical protein
MPFYGDPPVPRKAHVSRVQNGTLGLTYADSGSSFVEPPMPFVGGVGSDTKPYGYFVGPPINSQVVVLNEVAHKPSATVSTTDATQYLPNLNPDEVTIYGPSGTVLLQMLNDGTRKVYSDGSVTISVRTSDHSVQITAPGGLFVNGTAVTVP